MGGELTDRDGEKEKGKAREEEYQLTPPFFSRALLLLLSLQVSTEPCDRGVGMMERSRVVRSPLASAPPSNGRGENFGQGGGRACPDSFCFPFFFISPDFSFSLVDFFALLPVLVFPLYSVAKSQEVSHPIYSVERLVLHILRKDGYTDQFCKADAIIFCSRSFHLPAQTVSISTFGPTSGGGYRSN